MHNPPADISSVMPPRRNRDTRTEPCSARTIAVQNGNRAHRVNVVNASVLPPFSRPGLGMPSEQYLLYESFPCCSTPRTGVHRQEHISQSRTQIEEAQQPQGFTPKYLGQKCTPPRAFTGHERYTRVFLSMCSG